MSASEQLKALDAAMPVRNTPFIIYDSATGVTEEIARAHLRYREVLPQIVAAVEALEKIADFPSQHVNEGEWQRLMLEAENIASEALVALTEVLK